MFEINPPKLSSAVKFIVLTPNSTLGYFIIFHYSRPFLLPEAFGFFPFLTTMSNTAKKTSVHVP